MSFFEPTNRRFPKTLFPLLAALVVLGLSPAVSGAATHHILVDGLTFTPATLTITTGDTVQWDWVSGTHTVTNGTGSTDPNVGTLFDQGISSAAPTVTHVFTSAGVVPFFCRPHELFNMKGTITVEDPAATPVTYTVLVEDFTFSPRDLVIRAGDIVEWRWVSGFHTTTNGASSNPGDNPGSLWNAPIDSANPTFTFQFNADGVFPYFCLPHELIDMKGTITVQSEVTGVGDGIGAGIRGVKSFPNPFTSAVSVRFALQRPGPVAVEVFDLMGRRVRVLRNGEMPAGEHELRWDGLGADGLSAPTGIYFIRVDSGDQPIAEKVYKAR